MPLPVPLDRPDITWQRLTGDVRAAIGDSMFDIWLAPLRPRSWDGAELVLAAPAETRAWVSERFGRVLDACAAAVLGDEVTVAVVSSDAEAPPATRERRRGTASAEGSGTGGRRAGDGVDLNPKFTFDAFVIGAGNRFAHAAALAVAENPGTAYNPLLLCGPPGVGKTHLLHAIGDYVGRFAPGMRVRATTAETFASEFVAALRGSRMDAFKARHRETDVLLVDDVQFLMRKTRTEEEFFHTFNVLRDAGAQIVLTSDRTPRDLEDLEDRLRDRLGSGLVADMRGPDAAARLATLRKRAALDGIAVPDEDVLGVIAGRVTTNVRALEGALIRIVAFASLSGRPLTPDLANEVLDELHPAPRGATGEAGSTRPTIADVQSATCEAFGLTREELLSASRTSRVTWPRQVAMYLAREHTSASLPAIGAEFGGRGHTTVLHACRRTAERLAGDPEASSLVTTLSTRLSTGGAVPGPALADDRDG
jgi:chromosomal replication initiator protein